MEVRLTTNRIMEIAYPAPHRSGPEARKKEMIQLIAKLITQ
jgi:hypothetical protein